MGRRPRKSGKRHSRGQGRYRHPKRAELLAGRSREASTRNRAWLWASPCQTVHAKLAGQASSGMFRVCVCRCRSWRLADVNSDYPPPALHKNIYWRSSLVGHRFQRCVFGTNNAPEAKAGPRVLCAPCGLAFSFHHHAPTIFPIPAALAETMMQSHVKRRVARRVMACSSRTRLHA